MRQLTVEYKFGGNYIAEEQLMCNWKQFEELAAQIYRELTREFTSAYNFDPWS